MRDFLILSQDDDAMIDAERTKFTAKVEPLCGGNYWKVELLTDCDTFNAGIYHEKADAQREVKRLFRTLKQFKEGKTQDTAFAFSDGEVSALELLNLFEIYQERDLIKYKEVTNSVKSCLEVCLKKLHEV